MSSSVLNIGGDSKDVFYRYKMPKLVSKIEGKGNGIKTVIPNMSEIAKALSRPATYPTKFFGCELGAQVKFEFDKDRYIVNGAHDAAKLQALLESFINKFVLCPACKNPETNLIIQGDNITRDCQACGANLPVDLRHKLCVFIMKNPPAQTAKSKKAEKQIAARQVKGSTVPKGEEGEGGESDGGDADDDELARRIAKEASLLDKVEVDEDDWGQDTSAEAVARRQKELAGKVSKLAAKEISDDGEVDPIDEFADYVMEKKPSDDEIVAKARELEIPDRKVATVLAQILFDQDAVSAGQIAKRAGLLKRFVRDERSQRALLGGLERLVSSKRHRNALMSRVPVLWKQVYDAELVEEDVVLAWADRSSDKFVKKKVNKEIRELATPFVNWLREAEEDEDDDEEDDE